jgi:replicative DNA helicase
VSAKTQPTASFQAASDAIADWKDDVLTGTPPVRWPVGHGALDRIDIGPGTVTLFGAAPNAGKSALTMQLVVDGLRLTPNLRALVASVEMSLGALLDRQLARLGGLDLTLIRNRQLGAEHADRLDRGLAILGSLADRLAFLRPPYDLLNVATSADEFNADLILLDYIQRIPPPESNGDRRGAVDATMGHLRRFADEGLAILAVSAVGRQKDARGASSYAGLNLASFRESSELEFGADSAYLLVEETKRGADAVTLLNVKNRHGEARDIPLRFDRALQRFESDEAAPNSPEATCEQKAALAALWARTPTANGEGDE